MLMRGELAFRPEIRTETNAEVTTNPTSEMTTVATAQTTIFVKIDRTLIFINASRWSRAARPGKDSPLRARFE